MNEINWKPEAVKQLLKLPKNTQQTIRDEVNDKLTVFPNCTGIKKLINHAHSYRLRAGDFRVFFDYDGDVRIISIEKVKKRDEHTY